MLYNTNCHIIKSFILSMMIIDCKTRRTGIIFQVNTSGKASLDILI